MNDNQNYFVKAGRTTSRVLAPPGGKTSICLGAPPPQKKVEEAKSTQVKAAAVTKVETKPSGAENTLNKPAAEPQKSQKPVEKKDAPVSSNAFASATNMNGANVMTGRPTSRVLAPPGGHTSIQLG